MGNAVTTWAIGIEFIKRYPEYKNIKPHSLLKVIYRFLKRFNLSIRSVSHIGQQLPFNSEDLILLFLKEVIRIRKTYTINTNNIINMDETALNLNMVSKKTLHKIGAKTISIKTQSQEKVIISVILSCCSYGNKLKPLVIFKGAKNGLIFKNLSKHELVLNDNVIVCCNANAWAMIDIIKIWIEKIYIEYFKDKNLNESLLIWDHGTMHNVISIQKLICDKKINYVFIPKGLTTILQPLDVSTNKVFKEWIRRNYESAVSLFKTEKVPKIKRDVILKWIIDVWNDDSKIKNDIIRDAFLFCGISNKMDRSEDEMFRGYDKINEQGLIENDFTIEDENDENNNISLGESSVSESGSSDRELENEES